MGAVTEAEILAASKAGQVLDCWDGHARRPVDAALLRRCCHELRDQVDPRGIRLRRATITGPADLTGLDIRFPVRFEDCNFDAPVVIEGAVVDELILTRCSRLPGLLANGVRVRRDLDLSGTTVTGAHRTSASTSKTAAIWLCESEIGGRLLCVDTVIDGGGHRSIQADRMQVAGNIRLLHRFTARGEVRLIGARIGGSLDLTAAHIESPLTGLALDLAEAVIEGSLFLVQDNARRPVIRGRIDMGRAQIGGQFLIRDAVMEGNQPVPVGNAYSRARAYGSALSGPRLTVAAETTLEGACQVTGGIDLSMSELSTLTIGTGCELRSAGRTALNLTNAQLLSDLTVASDVTVRGTVRLTGARIHGTLTLRGAILSEPEGRTLIAAQGSVVDGGTELQELRATGGRLRFSNATLGNVVAVGAELINPAGFTLSLHQATINGSVVLVGGFRSEGLLSLNRCTVAGRLECGGGTFTCPAPAERNEHGHAIEAISAVIRGGMYLDWTSAAPSVDFTNATTTFLADDPGNWPRRIVISGFTYDRFEQPPGGPPRHVWDHSARRTWLESQHPYDAGPYEQAARVFRQHGYTDGATALLIAQRRRARRAITGPWALPRRALDTAYSLAVGYGYRPGRVLWMLTALLLLVTGSLLIPGAQAAMRTTTQSGTVYTTRGPLRSAAPAHTSTASQPSTRPARTTTDACGNGHVRCFNPLLYAIDTVIPLVSLDQRSTWYPDAQAPDGAIMQWWLNAATILGWLLSTIFVLSLASLARTM